MRYRECLKSLFNLFFASEFPRTFAPLDKAFNGVLETFYDALRMEIIFTTQQSELVYKFKLFRRKSIHSLHQVKCASSATNWSRAMLGQNVDVFIRRSVQKKSKFECHFVGRLYELIWRLL